MQAEAAALALIERGVVRPPWAEHVGAVTAGDCYVNSDLFGDRDEVVCVFSYAGEEPHALVMVVDYNAGGMLRDGWVTSQVDRLLERCRAAAPARRPGSPPGSRSARWSRRRRGGCWRPRWPSPRRPAGRRRASRSRPITRSSGPGSAPCRRPAWSRGAATGPPGGRRHRAWADRPRVGLGRGDRPAARLDPGPPGHAGGRVPRLRRGRGPVGHPGGQPLRGPHHRLRLRPGLRAAAADEPGQGSRRSCSTGCRARCCWPRPSSTRCRMCWRPGCAGRAAARAWPPT